MRVAITGAASGIGAAMARALAARGDEIWCSDLAPPETLAAEIGGHALACDVRRASDIAALVRAARPDLFVSNAGVLVTGGTQTGAPEWDAAWQINALAHVHAARALLAQGHGRLAITASAAGLLTQIGALPYAATKHAAVAIAEWLAIEHPELRVSVLCPQAVDTPMLEGRDGRAAAMDGVMVADEVARHWVAALEGDAFLVLPHPEVAGYARRRAEDRDRWLAGMRRLRTRLAATEDAPRSLG